MTVPTVNVTAAIYDQSGAPVVGATVTAEQVGVDLYNAQYVWPATQTFTTDVNGQVTMPLFPNAIGLLGSYYHIKATNAAGKKYLDTTCVVPNSNTDLSVIANNTNADLVLPTDWNTVIASLTAVSAGKQPLDATLTALAADGTGASLTAVNAVTLLAKTWAIPDPIGATTPNGGAFTTLSASGVTNLTFGLFRKADPTTAAFVKTGAFTMSTQAAIIYIEVNGVMQSIAASTAITMPGSPAAGTDYAIWAKTDGTLEATADHVTPPTANARKIGGFHYAPGGNATGVAGGDTTPAINAYSIWDLKFRPACPDPRGMTLVADGFWADIYLLGVDHPTNGSSKYNVTIADGNSPAKIPAKFGGNGTTAYGGGNWWDMHEVMRSFGKRFPNYSEFAALAYGTTEATSSGGTDVPTTGVTGTGATSAWNLFTSKWGVVQAAGNLWVWGDEFGGGTAAAGWVANTGGRGSTYQLENAVLLGGNWGGGVVSGSRASDWNNAPTVSLGNIGARGVCDHLQLD